MADFNLFSVPDYYGGLLGEEGVQKLQRQALGTGLINAALGFIAQPRNQRYGSALPYLGKALAAGYESGQDVIKGGLRDYETKQKIEELQRQKKAREAYDKALGGLYTTTPAQFETVTTPGGYAPAQTDIQTGQVSPNYGMTKLPDVTTQVQTAPAQQTLNKDALMAMVASGDPRASAYLTGLKTLKEVTTPAKADLVKVGAEEGIYDPNKQEWVRTPTVKTDKGTTDYQNWTTYKQDQAALGKPALSFNDWLLQSKKAGATSIVMPSDKGLNAYEEAFAKQVAERNANILNAGEQAPEQLARAQRVKSILARTPIVGSGATAIAPLANALSTAGLISSASTTDTNALLKELAGITLSNVKSSGLGAGAGFSNNDLKFLNQATSAEINWDKNSINNVINLYERSAKKAIEKYNSTVKSMNPKLREYYNYQEIPSEIPQGTLR